MAKIWDPQSVFKLQNALDIKKNVFVCIRKCSFSLIKRISVIR